MRSFSLIGDFQDNAFGVDIEFLYFCHCVEASRSKICDDPLVKMPELMGRGNLGNMPKSFKSKDSLNIAIAY